MTIDPTVLATELTSDPQHYGYASIQNDDQIASVLNEVNQTTIRSGGALTNGQTNITSILVAALPYAMPAGSTFQLVSGGTSQQVTVGAAGAAAKATSIPTVAFTATGAFPVGTAVYQEPVNMGQTSTAELQNAVVAADFSSLTAAQQNLWLAIILSGGGKVNISESGIRAQIGSLFGAGTTTRANLLALQTRAGSRAEVLFGVGSTVTSLDITAATGS